MTPDPLPVALPELRVHAWYWYRKAPPEYGPGAGGSFVFDNESQARNGSEPGDVIDGLVRKSDAEAALRAQAEEVAALRADAERWRTYSECAQHTWNGRPLGEWLQFDAVMQHGSREAAIDMLVAHRANLASKQEKPHG